MGDCNNCINFRWTDKTCTIGCEIDYCELFEMEDAIMEDSDEE